MATAKKFNVRHGLSAGTGTELKDVIDNLGKVIDVGTLPDLKTTAKTNTVAAINELYDGLASSNLISETFEPMGVANRSHSVISFDNSTRTFTISPSPGTASFVVWTKAAKRTYTSAQSVSIGASPATGLYYIYFDPSGVLSYRTTYFDWENDAMVAYVYWNAATNTAPFVADERHGIAMDWATHEYLHRTRGAVIANGFSISNYTTAGDGSLDTHAQFDLGNGTFFDEDLEVNITHSETPTVGTFTQILQGIAEIPVFYHSGAEGSWVRDAPTQFAAKQSATTLQYNVFSQGSWTTTPATDNRYVVSWIVATNEINYPILSILGQNQYSSIGEAEAIGFGDLILTGFPIVELRPLWKVIFRTSSGYTNTPNAYIANILDIRQLRGESGGGSAVSDHGLLTGLVDDDHSQYLHTTNTRAGVTAEINTTGKITTTNNVGIGTTTPEAKLHIYSGTSVSSVNIDSSSFGTALYYSLGGVNKYTAEYVPSSEFYAIGRSGVAYDFTLKNGNVGIGTTNPGQKLDVRGNIYNVSPNWIGYSDYTNLKFSDNFVELRATSTSVNGVSLLVDGSTKDLLARVFTNGIYVNHKIWHEGNDGIGSTLNADLLDGQHGAYYLDTSASTQTKSGGLNVSGNVGIGITNPGSKLAVNGYITESTDNGTNYWNVVTQQDVGTSPNQVPLNQYLGQLAFLDDFSPNGLRAEGASTDSVVVFPSGISRFYSTSDYQIILDGNGTTWAGILFVDPNGSDTLWFNGTHGTFSLGGGGANVAGKKLHVDGGVSIGSTSDQTVMPTEGLYVQGNIQTAGALHGPSNFVIDPAAVGDDTGTVEIKGNLTVQGTTTTINSTTVDLDHISLGDSEVANFGDSNDLQIYHDGVDSYIRDTATGNLNIYGDNEITIRNGSGNEYKARFITDGAVELYYDGVKKFETASGGVKIQPSSNSQGVLEVQSGTINADSIRLQAGGTVNTYLEYRGYLGHAWFVDQTEVARVTSSGNVGVGTTNPTNKISVGTGSSAGISIDWSGQGGPYAVATLHANMQTGEVKVGAVNTAGTHYLTLYSNNSEAARITSTGNVGIGTTSPSARLQISDSVSSASSYTDTIVRLFNSYNNYDANGTTSYPILSLERAGKNNYTYSSSATFGIARYEDAGPAARTRLDIRLAHGNVSIPDTDVLSLLSSGRVGIGITNPDVRLHVTTGNATGYIKIDGGTAPSATTGLQFRADSNAYSAEISSYQGNLQFVTGVTERARIDSSGNVGIGTNNPATKLDVVGAIRAEKYQGVNSLVLNSYATVNPSSNVFLYSQPNDRDSWIYLDSADTGSNWGIYHRQIDSEVLELPRNSIGFVGGGNSALKAYISLQSGNAYFSGNVGIGTTNSQTKLSVYSGSNDDGLTLEIGRTPSAGEGPALTFRHNTNNGTSQVFAKIKSLMTSGNDVSWGSNLSFFTGGNALAENLTISSTGNVGIGDRTPGVKLEVVGTTTSGLRIKSAEGNSRGLELWNDGVNDICYVSNYYSGPLILQTADTERLRIVANGNVGIGITNPTVKTHCLQSAAGSDTFYAENSASNNVIGLKSAATFDNYLDLYAGSNSGSLIIRGGGTERLRISSSGNVGIGITNPAYKLEVNGSFAATTKSFVIDHPTKEGYKLRYGSLEGPENGVYVRGKSKDSVIELPEYWVKLIDENSITVNLTPFGKPGSIWVERIEGNKIYVGREADSLEYFYMVLAERADVDKLEVEVADS